MGGFKQFQCPGSEAQKDIYHHHHYFLLHMFSFAK